MTHAAFQHRACYVNFAEHLQNTWNPNLYYPGAPNRWTLEEWRQYFVMLRAFGFTCFEYWLPPTLMDKPALLGGGIYAEFAATLCQITEIAHTVGLQAKYIATVNTIGPSWYFACPNDSTDKQLILDLWRHWAQALVGTDIIGIFPGDPGGCNRNGCTHAAYIELALELSGLIKAANPSARVEVGTWGTPFSGWGTDMRATPGWRGEWELLIDEKNNTPETPCHIWNGDQARAEAAMTYFLQRLPAFPADTMVAINLGFDSECFPTLGGDARPYAREIAKTHAITSWDYALAEGELLCYPHWRLPRMAARRREERAAAPYLGGMSYTMTPKLNVLSQYAAGRFFQDPDADPDQVSQAFCAEVFGDAQLGELFEAFEVVPGWGHYPRKRWSKAALCRAYTELIERLAGADLSRCTLPLFPEPEYYRQDLLWFARQFLKMARPDPDREDIRQAYWARALAIYDVIPMSVDKRAELSARQFSQLLAGHLS